MEPVNLGAMLARFTEHWSPKKIAQVNDYDVRIVKVQGEFTWHQHPGTDESTSLVPAVGQQVRAFARVREMVLVTKASGSPAWWLGLRRWPRMRTLTPWCVLMARRVDGASWCR
jgi:hypothetical protein